MKRFLTILLVIMALLGLFDFLYFYLGVLYIPTNKVSYFSKTDGDNLCIDRGQGFEVYDIKGVNLGLGKPSSFATDYAITKDEYLKWFQQIQELGANTIRTYILAHPAFYEAFYEYNINNPNPLFLLHGVWVDDYLVNSSYSALDPGFYEPFIHDIKNVIDAIHGRFKNNEEIHIFPDVYKWDISPWVYGYILGVAWDNNLVAYTNNSKDQLSQFDGTYFYTEDANNFEIFLARVGEEVVRYETRKYGQQRVIAFSNWPATDPIHYPDEITEFFKKVSYLDAEHIHAADSFLPGQFASYHVYPYFPDYYQLMDDHEENTYLQYLKTINEHHSIPVLISEFGVPTSRGIAAVEEGMRRNQGHMNENAQGEALIKMYQDIMEAGSAGGIVFSWQDEWFKQSWNTMAYTDLEKSAYWSNAQTSEQFFGLLSFDLGEKENICYLDEDDSEWKKEDFIVEGSGYRLSMKQDSKYLYFLIQKDNLEFGKTPIYIPIDITPKSGAYRCEDPDISMNQPTDFIIILDGAQTSRVIVQERYDGVKAIQGAGPVTGLEFWENEPAKDSQVFNPVLLTLTKMQFYRSGKVVDGVKMPDIPITLYEHLHSKHNTFGRAKTFDTGRLKIGNSNPAVKHYDSLADFCKGDNFIELRIPWHLLNFSDPTTLKIHDDYYAHFGVEELKINNIFIGIGNGDSEINMVSHTLTPTDKFPVYHERLKRSYYILQDYWKSNP